MDLLHDKNCDPFDRSIDVLIGRLRKKIEIDPRHASILTTVRGGGYQCHGTVCMMPLTTSAKKTFCGIIAGNLLIILSVMGMLQYVNYTSSKPIISTSMVHALVQSVRQLKETPSSRWPALLKKNSRKLDDLLKMVRGGIFFLLFYLQKVLRF